MTPHYGTSHGGTSTTQSLDPFHSGVYSDGLLQFSEVEMEEYGDLLHHEQNNSLDDEETETDLEEILKQFALSSAESESHSLQTQNNSHGHGAAEGANQTTSKHIMAERKRRQELSRRFIALSAIIPGLHKIDKVSILKEAIGYVKHLQNRVRELEEHGLSLRKKINVETVSLFDHKGLNVAVPKVEARMSENDVLIRIHCDKHNGVLLKILSHIKCLDFSVVRTSVLPFGNCAIYITIIAQMGDKCKVNVKDLVKSLRRVLLE